MIPRIIHYVWVGPKPIPDADQQRISNWRKILPDWEFRLWHNDNVDISSRYVRQAYAARAWNRISDYARMDALYKFGGVYLDTDVDLIRPLEPLLSEDAFLGFQLEDEFADDRINGAVLGASIGHWLPAAARRYLNENVDGRDNLGSFSGPGMLTKLLKEKGLGSYTEQKINIENVTIFPKPVFYPYFWLEPYTETVIKPETYTVHRWSASWKTQPSFRRRVYRKSIKLLANYAPQLAFRYAFFLSKAGGRAVAKEALERDRLRPLTLSGRNRESPSAKNARA